MPDSATARALVLEEPRRLAVREFPLPVVGDDDALVRVQACGLCGTDREQYTGELRGGFAFVPGHETVGAIEAIGPRAAERWAVAEGDRVAVEVFQSCRDCNACRAGEYRRCERHGLADMYGFIPSTAHRGCGVDTPNTSTWRPIRWCCRSRQRSIPSWQRCSTHSGPESVGAQRYRAPGGDVVAVLGPGIRGLCAAAAAKEAGAGFVLVTGLGPRDSERLALASEFGADLAVDVAVDDPHIARRWTCWRPIDIRSPIYRAGASGSTTRRTCSRRWPVSVAASRRCMGC
jgi:alcohol dehydrogenase